MLPVWLGAAEIARKGFQKPWCPPPGLEKLSYVVLSSLSKTNLRSIAAHLISDVAGIRGGAASRSCACASCWRRSERQRPCLRPWAATCRCGCGCGMLPRLDQAPSRPARPERAAHAARLGVQVAREGRGSVVELGFLASRLCNAFSMAFQWL